MVPLPYAPAQPPGQACTFPGRNNQVSTGRGARPQHACLAPPAPPGTSGACWALARCEEGFLQPGCKASAAVAEPVCSLFSYCCNLNVLVCQTAAAKLMGIKLRKSLGACRYSKWPAQLSMGVSLRHINERKQRLRKPAVFLHSLCLDQNRSILSKLLIKRQKHEHR